MINHQFLNQISMGSMNPLSGRIPIFRQARRKIREVNPVALDPVWFELSLPVRFRYFLCMENQDQSKLSFGARVATAMACFCRVLANPEFARQAVALLRPSPMAIKPVPEKPKLAELLPERLHASGLAVLSLLQREGRLIDFLQEEVAAFSDAEIGAAARLVHGGCKKVLKEYFTVEPILRDAEGAGITVPAGFDAQRIRLTGNVTGQPPFRGTVKHHGWEATAVRLPAVSPTLDPRVIVAAEVEL